MFCILSSRHRRIRRAGVLVAGLSAMLLGASLPPGAMATIPLVDRCTMPADSFDGPVKTSPNVEFLGSVPGEAGDLTPGGRLVGHYFYVTGASHFSIYDVADPVHPKLMSRVSFPCRFENEDVAVNGDILLYSDFGVTGDLFVYDVRNKSEPKLIADVPGAGTHTMECVDGCRYAYGSYRAVTTSGPVKTGEVVDLADPAHPKVLGDWTENDVLPSRRVHDATEVSPGLVLTASDPMLFLDTRQDPTRPTVLARSETAAGVRYHTAMWPRGGQDRFILSSFETNGTPNCAAGSGDFSTFDASQWQTTHKFTRIDSYFLQNGTFSDGNPPFNVLGCSPHWFNVRPSFNNGGVVALGAYDHGTQFLRVNGDGKISEIGYALSPGTEASGGYWITCDIIYTVDYTRGIDILRLKDPATDCPAPSPPGASPAATLPPGAQPPGAPVSGSQTPTLQRAPRGCASRRHFRIRLRLPRGVAVHDVRFAQVYVNGRRIKVLRGRRLTARIDLRGLPRRPVTVGIKVVLKNGRTFTGGRRYHPCVSRRHQRSAS